MPFHPAYLTLLIVISRRVGMSNLTSGDHPAGCLKNAVTKVSQPLLLHLKQPQIRRHETNHPSWPHCQHAIHESCVATPSPKLWIYHALLEPLWSYPRFFVFFVFRNHCGPTHDLCTVVVRASKAASPATAAPTTPATATTRRSRLVGHIAPAQVRLKPV